MTTHNMYICISTGFMNTRRFSIIVLASLLAAPALVSGQRKADKKMLAQIKADIEYLSSDALEGRRTGTDGERKAAEYIEKRYQQMHIAPYNGSYYHPFKFNYGKEVSADTRITINDININTDVDGFPMPFSANKKAASDILPDVMEQGSAWMIPIYADQAEADNPHFDWEKTAFEKAREAAKQGATAVIFFDMYGAKNQPIFNKHTQYEPIDIPAVYIGNAAYKKAIAQKGKSGVSIYLDINIAKTERSGNNLAAFIDNHKSLTVVLGAHYDHLGYGEDHNSLHANAEKQHEIHNGADDNASGTAALLEMAKHISDKKLRNYNYLFVNFSGEELGLYGSKAFVKQQGFDSNQISYMINMDMVGRLNDSTHALTLGGVGTSPSWAEAVALAGNDFKLVIDSAGSGPSDHTSFYNAGIPVLFFFTGLHKDYHKPTDDAALINYPGEQMVIKYVSRVVAKMDKERIRPSYRVTKQATMGKARFKVSLGIMPDYTYDAGGIKVDGVTDNKPAIRAGIKAGDIITKVGEYKINGMQSYMEILGKLTPGQKTEVTILRGGKEMILPIEMNK